VEVRVTESRNELHNANIVRDVAEAGGCGLKNLQSGATCGLESGHHGPCDFMTPSEVPAALAAKGIDLKSDDVG
jgi:hypothetical protein